MELCRSGTYKRIFQTLLSERYNLNKLDLSVCSIDTDSIPAKKGGRVGYDRYKHVKGSKISTSVDKHGLPISIKAFPANTHDSKTYKPTMDEFKIKNGIGKPITRPKVVNADSAYDSEEIRNYNRVRGIKSNIPENERV